MKEEWSTTEVQLIVTTVFIDSSTNQPLATYKQVSSRNKHLNVKNRLVNSDLNSKIIFLKHVASSKNPSEILTNILDLPSMTHLSHIIRLVKHQLWQVLVNCENVLSSYTVTMIIDTFMDCSCVSS